YLRVEDVEAEVSRLEAAGVEIVGRPHAIFRHEDGTLGPAGTEEWQAFLTDSEGNTVGLVEQRVPDA
ncbi:MAG: VOC family protein, partial [Nocardioides sp.]